MVAEPPNSKPKWVASRTLGRLAWRNSTLLEGAVRALKGEQGGDIHVIGSPELVRALLADGLVDELRLMIDPVVLGRGKRIFDDDGMLRSLRLLDSEMTSAGAICATCAPAA